MWPQQGSGQEGGPQAVPLAPVAAVELLYHLPLAFRPWLDVRINRAGRGSTPRSQGNGLRDLICDFSGSEL